MESHILHNRREQAAACDDNAVDPDRGNRHNSAVDCTTQTDVSDPIAKKVMRTYGYPCGGGGAP
jgi:hypothetical protein